MPEANVWTTTVIPVLGGCVAIAMFGSPVKAVLSARKRNDIGPLNLLPFVFTVANCVSWIEYSFLIDDWYLFVPNCLGLLIGFCLFLITFGIGIPDKSQRDRIVGVFMVLATILPLIAATERLILETEHARQQLWGYTANAILFCYYTSPLSTLALVLRNRDSSSLTLPLCIMNIANGSLWFTYGLARGDPFMWVPNGVGTLLGVVSTALRLVFPQRQLKSTLSTQHLRPTTELGGGGSGTSAGSNDCMLADSAADIVGHASTPASRKPVVDV